MHEAYSVTLSYRRPCGSWVENKIEIFVIDIGNAKEKRSYYSAKLKAIEKYGEETIVHSVTYV